MRYSRQEILIGKENQELLNRKTVCVVGLGALGSNSSNLLTRSGVNLILVDKDKVELSNLQRQNIYTEGNIGLFKSDVACDYLKSLPLNDAVDLDKHRMVALSKKEKQLILSVFF